jgi:transcriptional regulator with XRE-family HTH domain
MARTGSKGPRKPRTSTGTDREIGLRLRSIRLDHNMSQDELATKLDISFQQVQKYEKGANRISAGRLLQIAKVLGTTPHEILGWEHKTIPYVTFDTEAYKLASEFRDLPDGWKSPIRALINAMINSGET